jgi:hypothetical protein
MYTRFFYAALSCAGKGVAMSRSPVQGVVSNIRDKSQLEKSILKWKRFQELSIKAEGEKLPSSLCNL